MTDKKESPSVESEHIRLLADQAAWAAIEKDREAQNLRVEAAVVRGIEAFFAKNELKPEHWIYLRLQLKEREESWGLVKRTLVAMILTCALTFGGLAVWEKVASTILASDQQRGQQHRSGQPAPEGQ